MKYGIHVLALEDAFGLEVSIYSLTQQIILAGHEFMIRVAMPSARWSGEAPHPLRIHEAIHRILKLGVDVEPHQLRLGGGELARQEAQAAIRTAAVENLYADGADRVLIMDPDELWRPGAFEHLHSILETGGTEAHYLRLLPVVGSPGYPVDGALDWALVYLARGIPFRYSRGFKKPGEPTEIRWTEDPVDGPKRIIHLTGVRPSIRDVRVKYEGSSHYGEPGYNFDPWLRDVLPHIRPGLTNVSFFQHPTMPNFWPRVREFTCSEWADIPWTIKPYLAEPRSGL